MEKRTNLLIVILIVLLGLAGASAWAVPGQINYQGKLTDPDGNMLEGSYDMRFRLYDAAAGGSILWTETQAVLVSQGLYDVLLGNVTPLTVDIFETEPLFLQVQVYNPDTAAWETLEPRQLLTSAAFAMKAGNAAKLEGQAASEFAEAGHDHSFSDLTGAATDAQIPDSITVNSASNADTLDGKDSTAFAGAVHSHAGGDITSKVADADRLDGNDSSAFAPSSHDHDATYVNENQADSINAAMIQPGAISSSEVLDNSLTAADLAADSVANSELAPNSVGSAEIINGAVTAADMQDGAALAEISDDDGPGSGLNADYLDNLSSSAFMSSGTDLWVNTTGDSMTGNLQVQARISASNPSTSYAGDFRQTGASNTTGGSYTSTTNGKYGSYIYNSGGYGGTGENYGLFVKNAGNSSLSSGHAYGIYSEVSDNNFSTYGGYFRSIASANYGAFGLYASTQNSSGIGSTYGGSFNSSSDTGNAYGLYSRAITTDTASTATVYGEYIDADHSGDNGTVYGSYATVSGSNRGNVYGFYGSSRKSSTDITGTAYGARFSADNDTSGTSFGTYSEAVGSSGTNIGVRSSASGGDYNYALYGSATGGTQSWAGYFYGDLGVDIYGTGTDRQSIILDPDAYALKMYNSNGVETAFITGGHTTGQGAYLRLKENDGDTTFEVDAESGTNGGATLWMRNGEGGTRIYMDSDSSDAAYMAFYNATGVRTIYIDSDISGDGRIVTDELQITGGSDLSEQFDVNPIQAGIQPGMVVSIDPENPGKLQVSSADYDKKVAGIISGANGVKPGMMMGQQGTEADGAYPVALSGRVYCWADTSNGPIEPGDLLTSSTTPGHAMRVVDYTKAQGAILGKAMSSLDSGKGMVLVLVTLQ